MKARPGRALLPAATAALAAILLPFLAYDVARAFHAPPVDFVEGWNCYHTSRLLGGGPLYPRLEGLRLTPLNYPPLSFLIIGALARATGMLLLTGRLVSLASLFLVCALLFRTILALTGGRGAALLGTLASLALFLRLAGSYVGSYDPQMLGHVFSTAALCLFAVWDQALTARRAALLGALCAVALFVKHLLLAAPLALALALALRQRRALPAFALAGLLVAALLGLGTWLLAGEGLLVNIRAFDRLVENRKLVDEIESLFLEGRVIALALPLLAAFGRRRGGWALPFCYFATSLLLGSYAVRGVGVDRNAWFDLFLACGMLVGLCASTLAEASTRAARRLAVAGILAALLPASAGLPEGLRAALGYEKLRRSEEAYLRDVALLRSIPGPALFEEPLLGFDAGKEFLFDPFAGSQQIATGRLPEAVLAEAIRRREFAVIVLTSDAETSLARLRHPERRPPGPRLIGWWSRSTLEAIRESCRLLDPGRRRYAFFYLPAGA